MLRVGGDVPWLSAWDGRAVCLCWEEGAEVGGSRQPAANTPLQSPVLAAGWLPALPSIAWVDRHGVVQSSRQVPNLLLPRTITNRNLS